MFQKYEVTELTTLPVCSRKTLQRAEQLRSKILNLY